MSEIPVLESKEKIEASGGVQPFGDAARRQAAASNVMSEIGSSIAINAAMKRSELSGLELGKTPQGDVFPSITKADGAFEKAYRTQARATLTLQAEKFLNDSLHALQSSGTPTAQGIQEFQASAQMGIEQIASNSPTQDREALLNSFSGSLMEVSQKLQNDLLKRDKSDLADTMESSVSTSVSSMFESVVNGNVEGAIQSKELAISNTKDMYDAGMISGSKRDAKIREVEISFITGEEYSKLQDAKSKGKLEKAISDFGKNKREDLTTTEHLQVGQKLLNLVKAEQSTENMFQSNLNSEAAAKISTGSVTPADISHYEEQMTSSNFNDFLVKLNNGQSKQIEELGKINFAFQNWSNPTTATETTGKYIDKAYDAQVLSLMQNNPNLDENTAKGIAAANAGFPIPKHIKSIEALARSTMGSDIEQAGRLIDSLDETHPSNLDGLSGDARAMVEKYNQLIGAQYTPQSAAEEANKTVFGAANAETNAINEKWKIESQTVFGSPSVDRAQRMKNLIAGSRSLTGLTKKQPIDDETSYAMAVKESYELNYKKYNGDAELAKAMTQKMFAQSAQNSTFNNEPGNNKPKLTMGSVEMAFNAAAGTEYIIKDLAANQLKSFIDSYNEQAKELDTFQWQMDYNGIVSFDEFQIASDRLKMAESKIGEPSTKEAKAKLRKEINELRQTIDLYQSPEKGQPKLKQVYPDGSVGEELTIGLVNLGKNSTFNGAQEFKFIGVTQNGGQIPLQNLYTKGNQQPVFFADAEEYNKILKSEVMESGGSSSRRVINQLNQASVNEAKSKQKISSFREAALSKRQKELEEINAINQQVDERDDLNDIQKDFEKDRLLIKRAANKAIQTVPDAIMAAKELSVMVTKVAFGSAKAFAEEVQESIFGEPIDLITVQDMSLNNGIPTNIPKVWNGKELTEEGAINMAVNSGEKYPSFGSVRAARNRAEIENSRLIKSLKEKIDKMLFDMDKVDSND